MTRPVVLAIVLILASSLPAHASIGVQIEGEFVRTGTFTVVTEVEVGQPVRLIVSVRDISDTPLGVAGGLVDVSWNANVLRLESEIDDTDATTGDVSPLFNQSLWTWQFTGVKSSSSTLTGMGAAQSAPGTVFQGDAETFFSLDFMPIGTGQANLTLAGRDFGLIVIGEPSAAAEDYTSVNPALKAVPSTTVIPDPNSTTGDPGTVASCCGSAPPVGMFLVAGCFWMMSSRRRRR